MIYLTFRIEANNACVEKFILTKPSKLGTVDKSTAEFRERATIAIHRRLGPAYALDNVYGSFQSPVLEIIVAVNDLAGTLLPIGAAALGMKSLKDYKAIRESTSLLVEDINALIKKLLKQETKNIDEEITVHEKYPPEITINVINIHGDNEE